MKFFFLLLVAVALSGVSCERHEFAETKQLHEHHAAGETHAGTNHEMPGAEEGDVKDGVILKH